MLPFWVVLAKWGGAACWLQHPTHQPPRHLAPTATDRHVILPADIAAMLPKNRLLSEVCGVLCSAARLAHHFLVCGWER